MKNGQEFSFETKIFKDNSGILRTSKALDLGIHPRDLYEMRQKGIIKLMARGLYRLSETQPSQPDLVTVAHKIPQGVLCLISALSFHDLTTHIPREVDVALKTGSEKPALAYPPTQFYWMSGPAFSSGIETHKVDDISIKIYCPEKTIIDCFKFRNRIGTDVAIEALKLYREKKKLKADQLMKYAKVCRMEKVIRPYLEAIL